VLRAARWKCRTQKINKNSPPGHDRTTLSDYIFATKAHIEHRKKIVKQQYSLTCPHNMVNLGLLAAEICWRVWGTPANFNGFCVLAALLHGSSGRQPNFAALSRGRHLYLAGRPSRWALATFLVCSDFLAENTRRAATLKTDCSCCNSCRCQIPPQKKTLHVVGV